MINTYTENEQKALFDPTNVKKNYKFTPDELRVLKECGKESFYNRCLPLSAIFAGSTYYAVKTGFLKGNSRFGSTPKVLAAIAVGYFLGKFSYQSKCAEKLMQLPHSQIGELLRQKRRGNIKETVDSGFGPGISLAPFSGITSSDTYSDISPYSSLDLDTTRPETPGLDDYFRPSLDNPTVETLEEMPPEQKRTTTYDELRKNNREEYIQKRIGTYKEPVKSLSPASVVREHSSKDNEKLAHENKYGDSWE